jgi:thiamine kinase-like enzyme
LRWTTTALARHFHKELRRAEAHYFEDRKPLDESIFAHLVFTHNNLNMRKFLLDDEDWLWVVDWGWSRFFPARFKYLAAAHNLTGWQMATKFITELSF